MLMAEICIEMGWTYQEYLSQPKSFIDILTARMTAEGKVKKFNKLKNKNGRH